MDFVVIYRIGGTLIKNPSSNWLSLTLISLNFSDHITSGYVNTDKNKYHEKNA